MLEGQRALRLWLELIALIEHLLLFCISCTPRWVIAGEEEWNM
jgi:hypothetical protein